MARPGNSTQIDGAGPVKFAIRRRTLRQIIGSGGGVAPSVAKLIGNTDGPSTGNAAVKNFAKKPDYRDYLRH